MTGLRTNCAQSSILSNSLPHKVLCIHTGLTKAQSSTLPNTNTRPAVGRSSRPRPILHLQHPHRKCLWTSTGRKHAAELAVQKRKQEHQNVETEVYGAQTDHRKHLPQLSHGKQGAGATTASPLKMKLPVPVQDKLQDKREKGSSLKLRIPVPSLNEKGVSSKEELKMKIKVSSERHSSSDESAAKSKHSSPLVSKEKHRDHSAHRHHHKHSHTHSGNGRSSLEAPASGLALRSPLGSGGDGTSSASSSSRKRVNPEASHNHHSKKNKSSKGGAGSSSHCSSVQQCVSSHSSVLNLPFPLPLSHTRWATDISGP